MNRKITLVASGMYFGLLIVFIILHMLLRLDFTAMIAGGALGLSCWNYTKMLK